MKIIIPAIFFFVLLACENNRIATDPDVYYTCSMDPQVIADKPGKCPICKMELTAVKKSAVQTSDDIQLSDQQVLLGNIQSDTIAIAAMGDETVFTGTLAVNEARVSSINAKVMGRIERLFVKNVGDYVSAGMPLYELYSEELNNAKQEYINALSRKNLFTTQSVIDFDLIIKSALNKLRLFGMNESQINVLETQPQAYPTTTFYSRENGYITSVDATEGGYVMEGGVIIQLADLSALWVEAQVFAGQLSQISPGRSVQVEIPTVGIEVAGKIDFINPELMAGSRINIVRITIPNKSYQLKPGMPAYVRVKGLVRSSLSLPTDAVIREKKGSTVWVQMANNTFGSRMVKTGIESNGMVEITHGLNPGDVVVVNGSYLLHSEFIFKRGADPMSGHNH